MCSYGDYLQVISDFFFFVFFIIKGANLEIKYNMVNAVKIGIVARFSVCVSLSSVFFLCLPIDYRILIYIVEKEKFVTIKGILCYGTNLGSIVFQMMFVVNSLSAGLYMINIVGVKS